ncbi:MAG: heavy metal translocating P-type ATPase [Clostridia bacterium]|nr:heavy metal translocating P-type ATPase [Clostridia bacterium]
MKKKHKRELFKIILSVVLLGTAALLLNLLPIDYTNTGFFIMRICIYAGVYMILGFDIIKGALKNVFSGDLLDERFLMTVASVAAFFIGEYVEGIAVIIFYSIGELFQDIAVGKSRNMISATAGLRVDTCRMVTDEGVVDKDPGEVPVGSLIEVRPGERIPIDGVVVEGLSGIDTSSLTGESAPRSAGPGDNVFGGTLSTDGLLRIRTTKTAENSSQERIISLVEEASMNKSVTERFITKFARVYTPAVVILAVLLAIIPSIITGDWSRWVKTAIMFLVVSCPCALVVSIPLAFFAGVGKSSKEGVLVKGAEYLERLAEVESWVFDKTGTVTSGSFAVREAVPAEGFDRKTLLDLAYTVENGSNHPIAEAIAKYALGRGAVSVCVDGGAFKELPGLGAELNTGDFVIRAGNLRYARKIAGKNFTPIGSGTEVYVFRNGDYVGAFGLGDNVRSGVKEAFDDLRKKCGAERIVMLSGDRDGACKEIAEECGFDDYRSELLPEGKIRALSEIIQRTKKSTVYVGDGINDAPVLALADVGVAMGGVGQDAAVEAADCIIMNDDIAKLVRASEISRKTVRIARQNVVFAIGIKLLVLLLAATGFGVMWVAVFADVGVLILAILNSLRVMRG